MPCSTKLNVSVLTPSESKLFEPKPLTISGLSKIFTESENIFWPILSFKNEVPLEIEEDDIALAKVLNIPFAILLSKIIGILSLPIFFGLNFLIVCSADILPNSSALLISFKWHLLVYS